MSQNKVWYLPGPFHQYVEDVKALAKERGLTIIDANVTMNRDNEAEEVPAVSVREAPKVVLVDDGAADLKLMRAELAAIGVLVEQVSVGELVRPEDGEQALRLFEVLSAIQARVLQVESSSQAAAVQLDDLREQIKALEQEKRDLLASNAELRGEADVVEMRNKLDKAGVQYRSNASKETLQKLVDDLPKD